MAKDAQDGFTLIEILIALTVFAIAILGISAMQTSSIRGNMQARVISEEVMAAVSCVEKLRMVSYGDTELSAGSHTDVDDDKATWVVTDEDGYKTVVFTYGDDFKITFIKSPE